MDYDYKRIAIYTSVAVIIALAVGLALSFLKVGEYSFTFGLIVAGLVAGYLDRNIDSSLIDGGVAGLIVGLVQGFVTSLLLPASTAASFHPGISLGWIAAGAIPAGVVALILSERN